MGFLTRWRRGCSRAAVGGAVVLLLGAGTAQAGSEPNSARVFLGGWVYDMDYAVDTVMDVSGPTHFFSSRLQDYVGGRIVGHSGSKPGRKVWLGTFGGVEWTKAAFMLDWETPEVISYDPLEASIGTLAIPLGMELNLNLGNVLHIAPYVGAVGIAHFFEVTIGDEDFNGSATKVALGGGAEASLCLGRFLITAGAGRMKIVGEQVDFEVDDVTFGGRYGSESMEYYAGVSLR